MRVTVNGAPYQQGLHLPLTATGGPVVVVLMYTLFDLSTGISTGFGVSSSFERWLADGRAAFY